MRRSIATVCLSGHLTEKLRAAAEAGFDGVELFEPDLVASELSPEEVRATAARRGLSIDLYQPFRDAEGVDEAAFALVLRRAAAKFALMARLGVETVLVCSNVATATIDSDEVSASQLRRLGDLATQHGVRIAFEALAWGRYIDDYRRAWRVVQLADHPSVGLCLDSFHVLSRGFDPAAVESIPGEQIFFVQLADAPLLSMDVLSWSRHHRLFPGEGAFDLPAFTAHVLRTGYSGPLSLEVFNDVFRQSDVDRTAVHALRSLVWVEDQARRLVDGAEPLLPASTATAFDFAEVRCEDPSPVELVLDRLGMVFRGVHRSKPVSLWSSGEARIVVNQQRAHRSVPHVSAIGLVVQDTARAAERARLLKAPPVHRRTSSAEVALEAVVAPDGTEVFFSDGETARWVQEFTGGASSGPAGISHVDHINLAGTAEDFDESVLFCTSVLGLEPGAATHVPGPRGLVRSQVMTSASGQVRLPLNVAPSFDTAPALQHVALACTDLREVVRRARERGQEMLAVPQNYYDDLQARLALDEELLAELRALDVMYDRDEHGEYFNAYCSTTGRVFIELVQRVGGYSGYGAGNAPVRLAAQARRRRWG